MKAPHTPGPWIIYGDRGQIIGADDGKAAIAHIIEPSENHPPAWRRTPAVCQANARLIAAAPELLALIKGLVEWEARMGGFESTLWDDARAAIAKATFGEDTPTFIEAEKQAAKERDRVYSLSEAVADLTWNLTSDMEAGKVGHIPDSREVIRLCIEWANEFEAANAGEQWIDREYMEAIDAFYSDKIKSL
jgi:hypothetical protein